MSEPSSDWSRVHDRYGRAHFERAGRWCDRCMRVHVEHLTENDHVWYWHIGPHLVRGYDTEQAARAAADASRA